MKDAMQWGTITASFTLQSFGLDCLANATKNQLEERMESFAQTV